MRAWQVCRIFYNVVFEQIILRRLASKWAATYRSRVKNKSESSLQEIPIQKREKRISGSGK